MLQSEALLPAKELQNDSLIQGVQRLVAKLQAEAQHHTTCSERGAGYVREETVEVWMERLPTLVQGYALENIWNEDETACF